MEEEGYSILIHDATILPSPGRYLKGYIFINKRRIVAMGEGEPEEEYKYALYLINGKNKIVTPGLICPLTTLSAYSSRFGGKEAISYEELYLAAKMAIQDHLLSGITTIGTVEQKVDPIARVIADTGVRGVIFVNADVEGWEKELEVGLRRWHKYEDRIFVGIYTETDNEKAIRRAEELDLPLISQSSGIKIIKVKGLSEERGVVELEYDGLKSYGFRPTSRTTNVLNVLKALYYIGMDPVELFRRITINAARMLKLSGVGELKVNYKADLSVFDVSEPPGWTAGKGIPEEVILATNPRVETVIVDGEVLVDNYQPLSIGAKDVSRARKLFGER